MARTDRHPWPLKSLDAATDDVYKQHYSYTPRPAMRTNIEIDDGLMSEAMEVTGLPTKKAAVEEALRRLVNRHHRREALAEMAGLGWNGDLNTTRQGRDTDPVS
jgi:Arc/MetJ family transcription regulator